MHLPTVSLWALSFYCLLGLISAAFIDVSAADLSLQLLQVIHRHGDRIPDGTFPTDPNFAKLNDLGFGQLTNIGKKEQYEFGQYLRTEYGYFLNQTYSNRRTRCQSSDRDRTIMSAYCALTGLFPPHGAQIWNENITWQPIPVHMVPSSIDYMLLINKNCELRKHITEMARIPLNKKNKRFYDVLTKQTGMNVTDADDLRIIFEALDFAQKMNWTVPSWAKPKVIQKIETISVQGFNLMLPDKLSQSLAVGNLLKEIVNNMENKTKYQTVDEKQINIYSTHDTVMYGFLSLLDVYNGLKPPLNSAILIELLSDTNSSFWVKVFYKNASNEEPHLLEVLNCTVPCPWDVFLNLSNPLIPLNITEECNLLQQVSRHLFIRATGAVFIITLLVLTSLIIVAIFVYKIKNGNYRKGYIRVNSV